MEINLPSNPKNEIPWKYTFIHPSVVEVIGGSLAAFTGKQYFAIKLSHQLRRVILNPRTTEERRMVAELPDDIKQAAKDMSGVVLPPEKVKVFHYKKDDWLPWAYPMVYAALDDIVLLEKLKLADMAALDGAISNIRIFKLGSLEHKIAPTRAAAQKLAAILQSNVGVGTMDFIWGPDIELIETKTAVHEFLGEEKYKPTLNSIYACMGIPPTLTGTFGAAGTTNNFISLKTLIQRLEYGRQILRDFWDAELEEIRQAMGFRFAAQIEFDYTNLGDEVAEKSLLIQLADRSLISDELLQEYFGNDPELERQRLVREQQERDINKRPAKSGPYHDPQFGIALKKTAMQAKAITPSQIGLRLDAKDNQLKTFKPEKGDTLMKQQVSKSPSPSSPAKKGQPQQGRPRNSLDKTPRQTKTFKPKVKAVNKAVIEIWARGAQAAISKFLTPSLLKAVGKRDVRQLTHEEVDDIENIKFGVLCNLEPLGVVDESTIASAMLAVPSEIQDIVDQWVVDIGTTLKRPLTLDEIRHVQVCAYTKYIGD